MREAVRRVAEHFPTAIVSGRCRDKVHYSDSDPVNSSPFRSVPFFLFAASNYYCVHLCMLKKNVWCGLGLGLGLAVARCIARFLAHTRHELEKESSRFPFSTRRVFKSHLTHSRVRP